MFVAAGVTGCGYQTFRPMAEATVSSITASGVRVSARLLGDDEWDSGESGKLLAVHVDIVNDGPDPLDMEPWDFALASSRTDTRPLSPLRAAMLSSGHHKTSPPFGFGIIRLVVLLVWYPFDRLEESWQGADNLERIRDFQQKGLAAARIEPGSGTSGVLFYEDKLSPNVELTWALWTPSGTPVGVAGMKLREAGR